MTSYSGKACESKIQEYKEFIKVGKYGNLEVIYSDIPKLTDGYIYKRRKMLNESPIELKKDGKLVCSISVQEIQGTKEAISRANGKCGVLGLGLGFYIQEIAKKENVTEIIVYEIDKNIIKLYESNFEYNEKIKIVHSNGFEVKREQFKFFFSDIYTYEITENVAYDYGKLIEIHDIYEYSFFGLEKFLLSCPMEELMNVYVPDEWMDMTKKAFERVDKLGQMKNIKKIRRHKALKVLNVFKEIL